MTSRLARMGFSADPVHSLHAPGDQPFEAPDPVSPLVSIMQGGISPDPRWQTLRMSGNVEDARTNAAAGGILPSIKDPDTEWQHLLPSPNNDVAAKYPKFGNPNPFEASMRDLAGGFSLEQLLGRREFTEGKVPSRDDDPMQFNMTESVRR